MPGDRHRHSRGRHEVTLTATKTNAAPRPRRPSSSLPQSAVVDVDASAYASRRVAAQGGVVLYGAVAPGGGGGLLNSSWSARTTERLALGREPGEARPGRTRRRRSRLTPRRGRTNTNPAARRASRRGDPRSSVRDFRRCPRRGSAELVAVSAPTAGSCSVVPTNASLNQFIAPETKFVVRLRRGCRGLAAICLQGGTRKRCRLDTCAVRIAGDGREDVYLPAGDALVSARGTRRAGGEGAATVDVTLVQTSMAGAALRNYTRWASTWPLLWRGRRRPGRPAGGPRAAETIDAKHTTQLVDVITPSSETSAEKLVEAAAVASASRRAALPIFGERVLRRGGHGALSAPLGVTAAAADGLVGALSNIIGVTANVTDGAFGGP